MFFFFHFITVTVEDVQYSETTTEHEEVRTFD